MFTFASGIYKEYELFGFLPIHRCVLALQILSTFPSPLMMYSLIRKLYDTHQHTNKPAKREGREQHIFKNHVNHQRKLAIYNIVVSCVLLYSECCI